MDQRRFYKKFKKHTVIEKNTGFSLVIYLFALFCFCCHILGRSDFYSGKTNEVLVNRFNIGSHQDFLNNNNNKIEL